MTCSTDPGAVSDRGRRAATTTPWQRLLQNHQDHAGDAARAGGGLVGTGDTGQQRRHSPREPAAAPDRGDDLSREEGGEQRGDGRQVATPPAGGQRIGRGRRDGQERGRDNDADPVHQHRPQGEADRHELSSQEQAPARATTSFAQHHRRSACGQREKVLGGPVRGIAAEQPDQDHPETAASRRRRRCARPKLVPRSPALSNRDHQTAPAQARQVVRDPCREAPSLSARSSAC